MQSTRRTDSALYFLSLPESGRLVRAMLTLDKPSNPDDSLLQQILRCRELLFLNPELLTAPIIGSKNKVIIVTSVPFLKSGKIQGFAKRVRAKLQDIQRALPAEVQMCLTYTLIARLAPAWNKVGDLLVQGRDFMMKTCKQNAVGLEVSVTDKQVCIAVDVFTVRLPPPQLEDFDISTAAIQRFRASDLATISPNPIFNSWCYVLPSMKKGEIVSVTHSLPPEGSLKTFNDLRKHWKNMHGYRLPPEEQDRTTFCHINFRLIGDRLFSYPLWCLRAQPVEFAGRADHAGVLPAFLGDLHSRLPALCGLPLRLCPTPLYSTPQLSSGRMRETHSSQPVNLSGQRPSHHRAAGIFSSQAQRPSVLLNIDLSEFSSASTNVSTPLSAFPRSQPSRGTTAARQKPEPADDLAAKPATLPSSSSSSSSTSTSSTSSQLEQRTPNQNDGRATSPLPPGQLDKPRVWQPGAGAGSGTASATQPPGPFGKPRTLLGLPVFGANAGEPTVPIFKSGFKASQRPAGKSGPPARMNFVQHVLAGKGDGGGGDGGGGESGGRVEKTQLFVPKFFKVTKQPASSTIPAKPDKPTRREGGSTSPTSTVPATAKPVPASRPLSPSFNSTGTVASTAAGKPVPSRATAGSPVTWQKLGLLPSNGATPKATKLTPADRSAAAVKRKAQGPDAAAKPKKPRAKPTVQQVNVEELAKRDQLGKVNAVTLLSWLRGRGVAARSADKKEDLVRKVLALVGRGDGGGGNSRERTIEGLSKFLREM